LPSDQLIQSIWSQLVALEGRCWHSQQEATGQSPGAQQAILLLLLLSGQQLARRL
jgi:hypothetical protein